jgi:hypothetical protein
MAEIVYCAIIVTDLRELPTKSCEGFLYLVKGIRCDGVGITASIPTGLPPRSGTDVNSSWLTGTYFWKSPGLGLSDDWTPPRCSAGSPPSPSTPLTGPLASASTVIPSDEQSQCRSRISGPSRGNFWCRNLDPFQ